MSKKHKRCKRCNKLITNSKYYCNKCKTIENKQAVRELISYFNKTLKSI